MEKLLLKEKLGRIPAMLDNTKMYCPYLGKGENTAEPSFVCLAPLISTWEGRWDSVGGFSY